MHLYESTVLTTFIELLCSRCSFVRLGWSAKFSTKLKEVGFPTGRTGNRGNIDCPRSRNGVSALVECLERIREVGMYGILKHRIASLVFFISLSVYLSGALFA